MFSSQSPNRKRRDARLRPEMLESRELLTGGAGNTFAIIPGTIAKAGQMDVIKFTIDTTHFHLPKGRLMLGVDVAKDPSTGLSPTIAAITTPTGQKLPLTHGIYPKNLPNATITPGTRTTAVTVPIRLDMRKPNGQTTFSVDVKGLGGTTGKFLLGFYLPGDATGNGAVTSANVSTIKSLVGISATSSKYAFSADANRNGVITPSDLRIARQNEGVTTNILPSASANLDPASVTALGGGVTALQTVHYTGTTTPGAAVKFAEVSNNSQPVATTADGLGNYSLYIPLGKGSNTFKVTTMDAFGQSVSGKIAPLTYLPTLNATATHQTVSATGTTTSTTPRP